MATEKKEPVSIRLAPEVYRLVVDRAEARGLSRTQYLTSIIVDAMQVGPGEGVEDRLEALEGELSKLRANIADALGAVFINLAGFPKEEVNRFLDSQLRD